MLVGVGSAAATGGAGGSGSAGSSVVATVGSGGGAVATSGASSSISAGASSSSGGGAGDIWFELEYTSSSSPTSPSWSSSATPGWGESEWAYQGESWPEAWYPLGSTVVKFDNIGDHALIIDSSEHLQVMIGLQDLSSYTKVVVHLEGRGYSASASAHFDVYNPWNGCGVNNVTMAHDWTVHTVDIDLGTCLVPGGGAQAIRVAPTSQGLALTEMRVTIEGAVF